MDPAPEPTFDANAKTYLFSKGNITEVEGAATGGDTGSEPTPENCDEVCTARRWLARHRQPQADLNESRNQLWERKIPWIFSKRKLAPILTDAWKLIDEEAARVLKLHLAGRKIVDFSGPKGWHKAAVSTGRLPR